MVEECALGSRTAALTSFLPAAPFFLCPGSEWVGSSCAPFPCGRSDVNGAIDAAGGDAVRNPKKRRKRAIVGLPESIYSIDDVILDEELWYDLYQGVQLELSRLVKRKSAPGVEHKVTLHYIPPTIGIAVVKVVNTYVNSNPDIGWKAETMPKYTIYKSVLWSVLDVATLCSFEDIVEMKGRGYRNMWLDLRGGLRWLPYPLTVSYVEARAHREHGARDLVVRAVPWKLTVGATMASVDTGTGQRHVDGRAVGRHHPRCQGADARVAGRRGARRDRPTHLEVGAGDDARAAHTPGDWRRNCCRHKGKCACVILCK